MKIENSRMSCSYYNFFVASLKEELTNEVINEAVMPLYTKEGRNRVFEEAKNQKMIPFVASMMCRMGIDADFWHQHYFYYKERNERIVSELDRVYSAMDKAGVQKLFVSENLGALLCSGRDIALFASGDVDNCSDYSEKEKIYGVLNSLGYRYDEYMTGNRVGMTSFYNEKKMPDDFHINICWGALYREKQPDLVKLDTIIDWNNLQPYQQTAIRLPLVDALLYICLLHISLHSYNRKPSLRLYEDIYNVTYNSSPNWDTIMTWAINDKNVNRIVTSSILSEKICGVTVPGSLRNRFEKKQIKKLINLVYDGQLKPEPNTLEVLKIELYSYDRGLSEGLVKLFFPPKKWLLATYKGNLFKSYFSYLRNLF